MEISAFDKEESPQLQIHDALRGIILRNKQINIGATGKPMKVKLEPSGGSEGRILSCLQCANEKISFLFVIPHLCSRIIHGSPETEAALGSECTEALYQLFINQFTWAESRKDLIHFSSRFWSSSIRLTESAGSQNGRAMETDMEVFGKPGMSPDQSAYTSSSAHVKTTKLQVIGRRDAEENSFDDDDALMKKAETLQSLEEFMLRHWKEITVGEEPGQDGTSTSDQLQQQTHFETLIYAALDDDKRSDHVRKCLMDNDFPGLLAAVTILNQDAQPVPLSVEEPDKCDSESQPTSSSMPSTKASESLESASCSVSSSTGISDVACIEPAESSNDRILAVLETEDGSTTPHAGTPYMSSKSLESLYIDQLFQMSSSSDYSADSNVNTTVCSSETDKRNMDYEIQAVLEKNASLSLSSVSSAHLGEPTPTEPVIKEISIDNGSGTSLGLEKDAPIFVEVSRKLDAESTSSETTSRFSSIGQSTGQATTVTGSGLSSTSEFTPGHGETDILLTTETMEHARKQKIIDYKRNQPVKGEDMLALRNRMKESIEERRTSSEVAAKAFGIGLNDYLLQQIKASYARILSLLTRNPLATEWIKTNFKLDTKDHLVRIARVPPSGCTKGLVSFYKYMTGLERLTKERLLMPLEKEEYCVRRMRLFWVREKLYLAELEELKVIQMKNKISMKALEDDWTPRLHELDRILASVQAQMNKKNIASGENIRNIVREGVTSGLLQAKAHETTMAGIQQKHSKTESTMSNYHLNSIRTERNWRDRKEALELELDRVIAKYDDSLTKAQKTLDELESADKANMLKILQLQKELEDTDERFEEMRITKKLRELLRNMEMADSFKRNRAARVIQAHWRRYKMRKLRKQRRKEKIRRKPKIPRSKSGVGKRNADDTQSEISCATSRYSTPAFKKEPRSIDSKRSSTEKETKRPPVISATSVTKQIKNKAIARTKSKQK